MPSRINTYRPRLEALEDRSVPAAGSLDPTFGDLGLVTTVDQTQKVESPNNARAIQIDGKIVVAGDSRKFTDGTDDPGPL
jgi:hypothetical protein